MTEAKAKSLLTQVLGVNPDTSDAMRLFLESLQRGRGQPVHLDAGSGGRLVDPWRCALCVVCDIDPDVSEDVFRKAVEREMDVKIDGYEPRFAQGEREWNLREILGRVLSLPPDASDVAAIMAVAEALRENQKVNSLQLNSAEETVRVQMGISRRDWARLGS